MKTSKLYYRIFTLAISIIMGVQAMYADITKTVGPTGADYTTLKQAFDAINAGTIHTGVITLQITGSTTETARATLNASGTGSCVYSSVNIYPTSSGLTISGSFSDPLIYLLGADNVTIDGRVNATGSTKSLTIENTSINSAAVIIRYVNSAENNTIKYCTLKASPNSVGTGIIYFTGSDAGNGNNNNIVEYCNITCNSNGRPANAVFTSGTSGRENRYNIIRNNNFYNVFNPASYSYTINISNSSSDWTISGNSFYETGTFIPLGQNKYYSVSLNTGNNHLVDNNYFGGTAPECGGTPMIINSSMTHYYAAIFVNGGLINKSTISNNVIRNMSYTSTNSNPWDGIYINSGNVDVTGNTIGAETGTGSITVTTPVASATATVTGGVVTAINLVGGGSGYTVAPTITFSTAGSTTLATAKAYLTDGVVTSLELISGGAGYTSTPIVSFDGASYSTSHGMIQNSAGIVNISNNKTGSITTVGFSNTYSHGFESIYVRTLDASAVTNITNNLYGSLTTANSIHTSSTALYSPQKQDVYGIYSSSLGTTTITGNTVANLTNSVQSANSGSKSRGIQTIYGSNTIQNNIVRNISTSSASDGKKVSASVIGISQSATTTGTSQVVSNNTIYNISNTHPTAKTSAIGIYCSNPGSGSSVINANLIHTINVSSTEVASEVNGLALNNGTAIASNNIINVGLGTTTGCLVNGIWDEANAGSNTSLYFNTVYVGGTVSSGTTSNTAALWNNYNGATRNYRNNILVNNRSGGSTGKHFAIFMAGIANATINYNDYYAPNGVLGKISSNEKATLDAWKLATGQDANSASISPSFIEQGGTDVADYNISATLVGVTGTGVTADFNDITRSASPKMGALETSSFIWQGSVSTDFATAGNWTGGIVPSDGADIAFAVSPDNHCVLDQNRIIKTLTNGQSSKQFVLNGKMLTLTGNLVFTNGAQINGTAANSHIVFHGASAQTIPAGSFLNNTIDILTINNANGLSLNGDLTIENGIALEAGNFALGSNTLTFNGVVTALTGTVTGGNSTNMIIGGSGSVISMPAITLNNLTINRPSGVTMYGNLDLQGTLSLTSGTLTIGSNTLTLKNSISKTSGNIDASNTASTLIFNNSDAITLPASIFAADVNNLSITGAGGITAVTDFTVNGVLNLAAANPSATKGLLDLWDGAALKTLTMGANATTIGTGDVTGIIQRNSFVVNNPYSFGNQFTTLNLAAGGVLPSSMSVKVVLSSTHSWATTAIHRYYDIIQTGGNSATLVTLNLHYLSSELNGNTEAILSVFDYHVSGNLDYDDHGRSNFNTTDKWVGITNRTLTYIAPKTSFSSKYWTIATSTKTNFTWLGALSTDWNIADNWVGGIPGASDAVIIPDASTTNFDPTLPASTAVGTMYIETGGILNGNSSTLTLNGGVGAWNNMGTFNAGTSIVIFTSNNATTAGSTDFYNVTVADGAKLTLGTDDIMRIAGLLSLSSTGILNAASNRNTVEFNGTAQTIVNPNGSTPGYHNLILSGSGTKTMPSTALSVLGDFTLSNTVSATAGANISITGDVNINEGASLSTGDFNHIIKGNLYNFGTFTPASGKSITFEGVDIQINSGNNTTNFTNLILNNEQHLSLNNNINISEELTLTAGNLIVNEYTLGINGTISRTAGHIEVSPLSSLSFGGINALVLNNDLFSSAPNIKNLTINRSGGVTLGNQNLTVNVSISLADGTLALAGNSLTINGNEITRTTGSINVSAENSVIEFANSEALTLPASVFSAAIHDLKISGIGGITSPSDFTVNGILNLQTVNPSATKGILDMWDGAAQKTLTMGENATTVGLGDVTGIIRRTSFTPNISYTFGNQYSFITFATEGTLPTEVQFKVNIGSAPSWKSNAILRSYDLIRTGGSGCKASLSAHYLDTELNGNPEEQIVLWNYTAPSTTVEYGSSSRDIANNWTAISYVNFEFFPTSFGVKGQTLGSSELTSNVWDGSDNTSWEDFHNWSANAIPGTTSNVIIPDASTTLNSPILSASTEIKTLTLEPNAVLSVSGSPTLTINGANGAFHNDGTFNPGTGTVAFSNAAATLTGTGNFYNFSINSGSTLWMTVGSTVNIAGAVTNSGTWRTVINGETTVNYNGGAQTVVVPNASTNRYYNLSLSGSGIKTLPATALEVVGNLSLSGWATATTANDLNIGGNMNVANTASLTIATSTAVNVNGIIENSVGENGLIVKSGNDAPNGTLTFKNSYANPVSATVEMYSKASKPTTSYKWQFFGIPLRTMPASPILDGSYVRMMNETDNPAHWYQLNQTGVPASFINLNSFSGYEITQSSAKTISFKGNLENKDYDSGQLTYTPGKSYPGQHLIGNSYTAAIDISKIEFGSDDPAIIENSVYLYNTGSYNDWTSAGGVSTLESTTPGQYIVIPKNVASRGIGIPGQIPSMQAFLVRVKSNNSSAWVKIPYSATGVTVKNTSLQRTPSSSKTSTRIDVKGMNLSDVMWLISEETCSHDFENGWDGYKFIGSSAAPQIYSVEADGNLQVNTVDNVNNTIIAFKPGEDENYSMTFSHQDLTAKYQQLYLLDLAENEIVDITESGTTYNFSAIKNSAATNRFKIITNPGFTTGNIEAIKNSIKIFASKQTIHIDNKNSFSGTFYLYDLSGRLLLTRAFNGNCVTSINTNLEDGPYVSGIMMSEYFEVNKNMIQIKK